MLVNIHWIHSKLAECLSILEVDDNALFILLLKPTTTRWGNAVALLRSSQQKPAVCPSFTLSYPHPPPKATTMVQHPLIKKGTAVRVQPASQSAGYEEEQPNPPSLGLAVSVTVIAAPLGVSSLGTKPSEVKQGGCQGGWWWLKCGEGASALATLCVIERRSTQTRTTGLPS